MDDKRHKRSDWMLWFGIVCGALVVYFGAYSLLATRGIEPAVIGSDGSQKSPGLCWVEYAANDGLERGLQRLFTPANWIDRTLFPSRWPGEFVRHSPSASEAAVVPGAG